MKPVITISTDKSKLNVSFIHQFLTNAYWARGRSLQMVQQSIDNSLCFGIYQNEQQIGFARVVTDTVIFAYLMDVFIDPGFRGHGYSKLLMQSILDVDQLANIKIFSLKTSDAHGLYEQFGFKRISDPELMMVRNA